MIHFLPKQVGYRAIIVYLASLITISILYWSYAMKIGYVLLGFICVFGFFFAASYWSERARKHARKDFVGNLFILALSIRVLWVFYSFLYYTNATGAPFEFGAADSLTYHEAAVWLKGLSWAELYKHYFIDFANGIGDAGYNFYLTAFYKIFGSGVIPVRIVKAILSAYTCVLIYRLSSRTFHESTGRMAGIMCALMPNLIIYCGYHLKETEMIFLIVSFLERTDYLIRKDRLVFWDVFLPTVLGLSLFFFRTALGAVAIFSFITTLLFSSVRSMRRGWKRAALIGWGLFGLFIIGGGTITSEVEGLWEDREEHASNRRLEQTLRGNQWAQYATGTIMAPMAFVLPFSTMIDVDQQYNQNEKHGGNFIRNFMGYFTLLAFYEAVRRKKWREFVLIGSFVFAYLGIVSLSGFSNSERFLLPGLPLLIMMWAYGISTLRQKTYRLLTPWCIVVFLMEFGWAYFKLGSRGMI